MSDEFEIASSTDNDEPIPIPVAKETKLKIDKRDHAFSILEELDAMRKDRERCDFKVKLGEDTMNAHRTVLSASSKYFKAMMSHDTLESRSGVVEFKDCDLESVRKCIDFIYTGEVYVEEENCEKLMHVAHMMQLDRLCDAIGKFLMEKLTAESFFMVKNLAQTYEFAEIDSKCDQFALQNLGALSQTDGFQNLEKDYILLLIKSNLTEYSENAKCKILIQWIKSRIDQRRDLFVDMLKELNITRMSPEYKSHLVQNEPLVSASLEAVRLFYLDMMDRTASRPTDVVLPSSIVRMGRLGVFTGSTFEVFDPATGTHEKTISTGQSVTLDHSAVVLHQHVYVFRPYWYGKISVHRFDPIGNTSWETLPEPNICWSWSHSFVVSGDFIYLFRVNVSQRKRHVQKFNPFEKKWTSVHEGSTTYKGASLVTCQRHIYSLGGRIQCYAACRKCGSQHGTVTDYVEKFDPFTTSWSNVKPVIRPREKPAVVEHNDIIYAFGGRDSCGSDLLHVECYNPANNTWAEMASMLNTRSELRALALSGMIYVVGGDRLKILDIERNKWTRGPQLGCTGIECGLSVVV